MTHWRCLGLHMLLAALIAGCTFQHYDNLDPEGDVDFTSFGGVAIVGQMNIDANISEPGPLELDRLQAGLISVCMDELEQQDGEFHKFACLTTDLSSTASPTGKSACRRRSCWP